MNLGRRRLHNNSAQASAPVWHDVTFKELTMRKLEADLVEQQVRIELLRSQKEETEAHTALMKKQSDEVQLHCALMDLQINELEAKNVQNYQILFD